jgi:hypothetical protein
MKRRALHCRSAWLGIFAVLFQALLPLGHHPATMFAPTGGETADFERAFAEAMVLCTPAGPVHSGVPFDNHAPAHHPNLPPCPICLSMHTMGGLVPPDTVNLTAQSFAHYAYLGNAARPVRTVSLNLGARPRAPPLQIQL